MLLIFSFIHPASLDTVFICFLSCCVEAAHTQNYQRFSHLVYGVVSSSEFDCVSHSKEISQTFSAFVQHFFHGILCKIVCVCVSSFASILCRIQKLVNLMLFPVSPSDFRSKPNMKAFCVVYIIMHVTQTHIEYVAHFLFLVAMCYAFFSMYL